MEGNEKLIFGMVGDVQEQIEYNIKQLETIDLTTVKGKRKLVESNQIVRNLVLVILDEIKHEENYG